MTGDQEGDEPMSYRTYADADRAAVNDDATGAAYIALVELLDRMTPEQLAEVAHRYRRNANHPAYEQAAMVAADQAYAAGRVRNVGTEEVPDDRVQGVPDDVAPIENLAGVAGGAGLDLALLLLAYDRVAERHRQAILALWHGVAVVPTPRTVAPAWPGNQRPTEQGTPGPRNGGPMSTTFEVEQPARPARAPLTYEQRKARAFWLRVVATLLMIAAPVLALAAAFSLGMAMYGRSIVAVIMAVGALAAALVLFARAHGLSRRRG